MLSSKLSEIRGVGPKMARLFSKKGVVTFGDALFFLPRAYEDRREIRCIKDLVAGARSTVRVEVVGTTVILRGRVADEDERRLVEGMVRLEPGVQVVQNELTIP